MRNNYQRLFGFACLFVSFVRLEAQETASFKITPEITKQILQDHSMSINAFPVVYKEIEHQRKDSLVKRPAYMISGLSVNINSIDGEFTKLPDVYRVVFADIKDKYVKEELIVLEHPDFSKMSKDGDIIRRVGTDEYYWIISDDNFVGRIIKQDAEKQMISMVNRLGYKEYRDEYGSLRVKSKTAEIKLDTRTYLELKKDPEYITKLDADQQKIAALVKQTIPHSKTLDKYLSLYNVQKSRMSSADLKAWRTATENAQKLQDQIYAIGKKYDGNTSFTLLDKSRTLDNFLDNLLASKGVLRM